ncbi:MAG: hypothetical protein ACOY0T_03510 [Myxococcota bacterium]
MKCSRIAVTTLALLASCGPDAKPQLTCAGKPDFVLTVQASKMGLLPEDTLISVKFGGDGHETYRPNAHNERQVLFCESARALGQGEGGAGGSNSAEAGAGGSNGETNTPNIRVITCELWTGGPAWVTVRAGVWEESQALTPKSDICTVWNSIDLGAKVEDEEP